MKNLLIGLLCVATSGCATTTITVTPDKVEAVSEAPSWYKIEKVVQRVQGALKAACPNGNLKALNSGGNGTPKPEDSVENLAGDLKKIQAVLDWIPKHVYTWTGKCEAA